MRLFELTPADISAFNDGDLRDLVARLCEAELIRQNVGISCVLAGGAQEAADGGLDVHVKDADQLPNPDFIPRKQTGFQVKKHSMGKAACKKEMLEKIGDSHQLRPAIAGLADKGGAYIIVSGKDDCTDKMLSDRRAGMREAVQAQPKKDKLLLDFYGRDSLAKWLRKHPGVTLWARSKLGKPLSGWKPFGRWATPPEQNDDFLLDDHPCVEDISSGTKTAVSLADGIQLTRDRLRQPGSTVRIVGLSGVGKTRFAQALFEDELGENTLPSAEVIYADLGDDLTPTASEFIEQLIANDFVAYVVLDNCPPDVHRRLQKQVAQNNAKLSLLTIEYDISDDSPEETEVICLEPASEATTSKLIQRRFPDLGPINANKIAEFANGNARIAIALANGVNADETLAKFSDDALFQRLFYQRKETRETLLDGAEILSLVYSFNISPTEFNNELAVLANISGLERRTLKRAEAELCRRQLAQKRGNWRAILPHALANRLARRALEDITPDEINTELFKHENLRLLKSCAHRLGYLHDFEPARQLAHSWVEAGGPLHDISSCDEPRLEVLEYIAPVFPETVLEAIEVAALQPGFASRGNSHFPRFIRLLRKIAYEDQYFDRATQVILQFAETERDNESFESAVRQLRSLFSLKLSGTHASPQRRQAFVKSLLASGNIRHLEIAEKLLQAALETSHWSSFSADFNFGARSRDMGWSPQTMQEQMDWYEGFIGLLEPYLYEDGNTKYDWVKKLLANYFWTLWSSTECHDCLERIVEEYAVGGVWPEMWLAIKTAISYSEEEETFPSFDRLEALEQLAAPTDILSTIKSYLAVPIHEHIDSRDYNTSKNHEKQICDEIVQLGQLVATQPDYLQKLSPQFWTSGVDSLLLFGEGLAKGSNDKVGTFEALVELMQEQKLERADSTLFYGFLGATYESSPDTAHQLQKHILDIPEIKQSFIYLLSATPITHWNVQKLIELTESGEFDAWQFKQISYGQMRQTITDPELAEILEAVIKLDEGADSVLEILERRFSQYKREDTYQPDDSLLIVGRNAIRMLCLINRNSVDRHPLRDRSLRVVFKTCLSPDAPEEEISLIIEAMCEGLETARLYSSDIRSFAEKIIINHPELFLDAALKNNDRANQITFWLFTAYSSRSISPFNHVNPERLVQWCGQEEERLQRVAGMISVYKRSSSPENCTVLSEQIKALLSAAQDKLPIVKIIFKQTCPTFHSGSPGSRANVIENRSQVAAKELLQHPIHEVREFAKSELESINRSIQKERQRSAERLSDEEQRFE